MSDIPIARALDFPAGKSSGPRSVLFWIAGYTRSYLGLIAVLACLSTFEIGLRLLTPWPMQAIVDYVLGSQPVPSWLHFQSTERLLAVMVTAGLLVQAGHHLIMMLHTRFQSAASQYLIRDVREHLFAHLQCLALTEHARMPKGDAVYRLEADAPCLDHLVFGGLFPLTFSLVTLLVMLWVLMAINTSLALISIMILPPMYLWLRMYTPLIAPRVDRTKKLESRVSARLYESFSAIQLIKAFATEPFERKRFAGLAGQAMEARIELGRHESTFSVVIALLTVLGNTLVVGIGGAAVLRGNLTLGTLLVVIAYLGYVYGPLSAIAQTTGNLQRALAGARRVRAVLALIPESAESRDAVAIRGVKGEIRFEDVSFGYDGARPVLENVTFTARRGETIALVGPSGAGKTTLASLIPRFYEVSSGRILIDDTDVRRCSLRSLRQHIALVSQDPVIMAGSVRDNLSYGSLDAADDEILAAARAANAHEFIEMLPDGYETDLGEAGVGLSGGQKQRLSIARAFLKNAPILILDEPTAALDTISELLVLDGLKQLQRGRTTLVIAHRLSTVRDADRILVIDQGRIVAEGTDGELAATCALYRRLCAQLR